MLSENPPAGGGALVCLYETILLDGGVDGLDPSVVVVDPHHPLLQLAPPHRRVHVLFNRSILIFTSTLRQYGPVNL